MRAPTSFHLQKGGITIITDYSFWLLTYHVLSHGAP